MLGACHERSRKVGISVVRTKIPTLAKRGLGWGTAAAFPGPLREFYENLLQKGMKAELARLTLARKLAAITLHVWKKGERFDPSYVKPQAA